MQKRGGLLTTNSWRIKLKTTNYIVR